MSDELQYLRDIQAFMMNDDRFIPQKDAPGKGFHFMQDGENKAYIWFKWALDGWRLVFRDGVDDWTLRPPIKSVKQLKTILSL